MADVVIPVNGQLSKQQRAIPADVLKCHDERAWKIALAGWLHGWLVDVLSRVDGPGPTARGEIQTHTLQYPLSCHLLRHLYSAPLPLFNRIVLCSSTLT